MSGQRAAIGRASLSSTRATVASVVEPTKWVHAARVLVEQHAEGEHVGARVDRLPVDLLGRHVRRRANQHARLRRDAWPAPIRSGASMRASPKSRIFSRPSIGAHHVVGLQIPVDDAAARARWRAPRPDRGPCGASSLTRRRAARTDLFAERVPIDEFRRRCRARRPPLRAHRRCRSPDASGPRPRGLRAAAARAAPDRAPGAARALSTPPCRPRRSSDARYTRPIPPRPSSRTIVYAPTFAPGGSGSSSARRSGTRSAIGCERKRAGARVVREQRQHLVADGRVVRGFTRDPAIDIGRGLAFERGLEQVADAPALCGSMTVRCRKAEAPSVCVHQRSTSCSLSSRNNQARASAHRRLSVAGDMLSASAVSSMLRPAK